MKIGKRIAAFLLICAILCGFVWAADGIVLEAKVPTEPVKVGDTVTIPVELKENPGIICGKVKLVWDEKSLELTDVTYGVLPDNNSAPLTQANGKYSVCFGDYLATEDYTQTGVLFSLTFKVLPSAKNGEQSLSFACSENSYYDFSGHEISAQVNSCTLQVTGGTTASEGASTTPAQPEDAAETLLNGAILLPIGSYAALYHGGVTAIYPGEREVTPYIKNDRTFVPIRFVAERLGAKVDWDNATRTVVVEKDDHKLLLPVGSMTYTLDGKEQSLDAPAEILNSRTMVPLRLVAEGLQYQVEWDAANRVAIVVDGEKWDMEAAVTAQAIQDGLNMIAMYKGFV